ARPCVGSCQTCGSIRGAVSQIMLAHEVLVEGLVEFRHSTDSGIDEVHQVWKGITEKPTDAEGHVNARALKLCQWDHLHAGDASPLGLPDRTHAQQGQHLANVIAMRAHGGGTPDDNAYRLWIGSLFGEIFVE